MKKILALLLTGALILTASACGKKEENETTTTAAESEGGKKTQVAFQAPEMEDTTAEAVEYLKDKVPLFSKYLETRMSIPLTFETEITSEKGTAFAGIYIRDDKTVCLSATDETGASTRTVYVDNKLYYIVDDDKAIYSTDYSEEKCKEMVDAYLLKISIDDAKACSYVSDYDYYGDTLYKHEIIYSAQSVGTHYFYDEATDELKYVVTNTDESKILALNNEVTESAFEIPDGYTESDLNTYLENQVNNQAAAQQ
ncbi:MAG: hypothetical protein J6B08_01185 [Ruminiclostridium sp.]|nr:hypothetical protein [Ruminiclostridium sp.]